MEPERLWPISSSTFRIAAALLVLGIIGCGSSRQSTGTVEPAVVTSRVPLPSRPGGDITPAKLTAWRRTDAEWARWKDASPHRVLFISVEGRARDDTSKSVKLEVLDWGGSGPDVILLAGSGGDSPYLRRSRSAAHR